MPGRITVGNVDIVAVLDMVPPAREPNMMFPTTSPRTGTPIRTAWKKDSSSSTTSISFSAPKAR